MRHLEFYLKEGIADIVKNATLGHAFFVIVLSVCATCVPRKLACLSLPTYFTQRKCKKNSLFQFPNQRAKPNCRHQFLRRQTFTDNDGHAYKRAFEFHVLAYLAEFINEYVRIFVKCPNVSQPLP